MSLVLMLNGKIGSGKDTAASYLCERWGFTRLSFGDHVRKGLLAMDPYVPTEAHGVLRLSTLVEVMGGWDAVKRQVGEVRRLLQKYGTEGGRDIHGGDCWSNIVVKEIRELRDEEKGNLIVISDLRFKEEFNRIYKYFDGLTGSLVRVVNISGRGEDNNHSSEQTDMKQIVKECKNNKKFDNHYYEIDNSLSIEILKFNIDRMVVDSVSRIVK
jgi:cytidylate kinase